eukprot:10213079-Alexandrium_andersonii.AAC.1
MPVPTLLKRRPPLARRFPAASEEARFYPTLRKLWRNPNGRPHLRASGIAFSRGLGTAITESIVGAMRGGAPIETGERA